MAGFAAAHGLARLTFAQRQIKAVFAEDSRKLHANKPTADTIGHLLVSCRKEAGLKQKEVAKLTGITRQWIGRWERARAIPNQTEWGKLATVLKFPPM
jgi:ribosome-binding protein aMBF1 (putative translation factor)